MKLAASLQKLKKYLFTCCACIVTVQKNVVTFRKLSQAYAQLKNIRSFPLSQFSFFYYLFKSQQYIIIYSRKLSFVNLSVPDPCGYPNYNEKAKNSVSTVIYSAIAGIKLITNCSHILRHIFSIFSVICKNNTRTHFVHLSHSS